MVDDELYGDGSGEGGMLEEAVQALQQGDRNRARDLLTRLLKVDQNNATYWVWLSAAVESPKERLYCLQMALQRDPQNSAARRGLVLLGGMPPDDSIPPFPVDKPRPWEDKLVLPKEAPDKKRGWANPVTRIFIILGIAVLAVGGIVIGSMFLPRGLAPIVFRTSTRRPTWTTSLTPSLTPVIRTATPTFMGATPLSYFLPATYTPTPLYVLTEHPITSSSAFDSGLRFMAAGDYANALVLFEQVLSIEEDAVDAYYYIGEVNRIQGNLYSARDAYQEAINIDQNFAPAYLGRARINLALDPESNAIIDLDAAVNLDPNFTEAYLERGAYLLASNPSAAMRDFDTALELSPQSALGYMYMAEAQLALDQDAEALASALHANQIDMTLIPNYLTMAKAYVANGDATMAGSVLQTYTIYEPDDVTAAVTLGMVYNQTGKYDQALEVLNRALEADSRDAEAYNQRGYAYLYQDKGNLAEADFKLAVAYNPWNFEAHLGLARAYFIQGNPGDAYVQVETNAYPLARTNEAKAQVFYWAAKFLEQIDDESSQRAAGNYLRMLINLPADVMPPEWRQEAFERLNITPTFTRTASRTRTPSPTPTLNP